MDDALVHGLHGRRLAAQAVHLRPAGDAGLDAVATQIAVDDLGIILVVRDCVRTRADQGHVALEHVYELRQLVEAGLAQEAADARHARVIASRLRHHRVVRRIGRHRAELEHGDRIVVEAEARLAEEHRPLAVELDGEGDQQHQRREEQQEQPARHDVLAALQHRGPACQRPFEDVDHECLLQHRELARRDRQVGEVGAEIDVDRELAEPAQDRAELRVALFRQVDDDLVDMRLACQPQQAVDGRIGGDAGAGRGDARREDANDADLDLARPSDLLHHLLGEGLVSDDGDVDGQVPCAPPAADIGGDTDARHARQRRAEHEPIADPKPRILIGDLIEKGAMPRMTMSPCWNSMESDS